MANERTAMSHADSPSPQTAGPRAVERRALRWLLNNQPLERLQRCLPTALACCLVAIGSVRCASSPAPSPPVVRQQSPRESILALGSSWQCVISERGVGGQGGAVRRFERTLTETLGLADPTRAELTYQVDESLQSAAGSAHECHAQGAVTARVVFGERSGRPAVELRSSGVSLPRECQPPLPDAPPLPVAPFTTRFVLRGDRLTAFEPATDRRELYPID